MVYFPSFGDPKNCWYENYSDINVRVSINEKELLENSKTHKWWVTLIWSNICSIENTWICTQCVLRINVKMKTIGSYGANRENVRSRTCTQWSISKFQKGKHGIVLFFTLWKYCIIVVCANQHWTQCGCALCSHTKNVRTK